MAVNKVVYEGNTLIDLTELDVSADKVIKDTKAIDKSGNKITGTLVTQKYYTGASAPSPSLGDNGDLFLVVSN